MKNFFKKKNKLLKIIATFALLLFIVFYACEKDFWDSAWAEEEAQTIEQVKTWYGINKPEEVCLRSSEEKYKIPMKPEWSRAFKTKNKYFDVVETDVMSQGRILFIDTACMAKYKETNDLKYLQCYTRMVFRINKETNDTVCFLMTVVPNLDWLEKSKFKPFMDVTYLFRSKQFGGKILFHNIDGSFSNGWKYEKGKPVGVITYMDADPVDVELRAIACHLESDYHLIETCTDWYTVHEDGDTYNGTTCTYAWEFFGYIQVCEYVPDPPNTNSDPSGYTGGTPSNPGTTQTPASVAPKATKIFRNSNMSLETWKALETLLDKMLKDCLGQGLYNGLSSALGGGTLAFEFSNNASGFNYGNGSISLDMSWESNRLFHEMWHAYQAYQETASSFSGSTLNQEFESWYAQYLYISKLPEYKPGSTWYAWYNQTDRGKAVRRFDRYVDKKGNLLQSESAFWSYLYQLSLPGSDFRRGGYESTLQYQYNDSRTAAYNFRNLTNLSKGC